MRTLNVANYTIEHETASAWLVTIPGAGKVWVGKSIADVDHDDKVFFIQGWKGMKLKCVEKKTVVNYEDLLTKFFEDGRQVA